jgi:hypothetical protein
MKIGDKVIAIADTAILQKGEIYEIAKIDGCDVYVSEKGWRFLSYPYDTWFSKKLDKILDTILKKH